MSKRIYEESNIAAIAEKIREKTGGTDTYTTAEMPEGVTEVYEAGKKSEYDTLWDTFQDYGRRTDWDSGFAGVGWDATTCRPKYPINANYCPNMFYKSGAISYDAIKDIDTSKSPQIFSFAQSSQIERLGVINCSSATNIDRLFCQAQSLHTVDKLVLHEGITRGVDVFANARSLKNIIIEGVVTISLNLQYSPLTYESIVSFITHLSDTATGQTLTLSKSAVDTAFATGAATYSFNDDDTELKIFLANENVAGYTFDFVSNGEYYEYLMANTDSTMIFGNASDDVGVAVYENGWVNEDYKTINVSDSSKIPVSLTSYLLKMAKKTSYDTSTRNDGSTSPEWLAFVATKPNWTITLA